MKHNAFTALSMAAALVVAGSAGASEFSIDFESYTAGVSPIDYASETQGAWSTNDASDASAVLATNLTFGSTSSTKTLQLDTGDAELKFQPTSTAVTVLEMDVCFVGADEAPDTTGFDGKTMVYLDVSSTPVLKAYANGTWNTLSPSGVTIADGHWYKLRMEFDGDTVSYEVDGTAAGSVTLSSGTFGTVSSVGFKGTGFVDNFVGDKAGIPAQVNGTDVVTATVSGTTVSVDYGSQTGIQFIRVYDSNNNYVTLRTSDASASIDVSKLSGTITRVDAITGANATAIPANFSVAAANVTTAVDGATTNIVVTLPALKSGLYYKLVDATTNQRIGTYKLVAPAEDGDTGETLTVPVSNEPWGVKKFKIVVDDEL